MCSGQPESPWKVQDVELNRGLRIVLQEGNQDSGITDVETRVQQPLCKSWIRSSMTARRETAA